MTLGVVIAIGVAVFSVAAMAWDVAIRKIASEEKRLLGYQESTELGALRSNVGAITDSLMSRARHMEERLEKLEQSNVADVKARADAVEASVRKCEELEKRFVGHITGGQHDDSAIASRLDTLEKALANFWDLVGKTFMTKEEFAGEAEKLRSMSAATVASGMRKFTTRVT